MIKTNLDDTELKELVKKATEAFNALSPEEQRAHRREQAISFAYGQVVMSHFEKGHPDFTPEEEEKLKKSIADHYDHRKAEKKDLSEP